MSYNVNSFVNKDEANALKEMIFSRVRERSQSMSEDLQSDVMDIARESFVSRNNPFSQFVQNSQNSNNSDINLPSENIKEVQPNQNIGFPQRQPKARAVEQARVVQEKITTGTINNNMNEAREGLTNKKSFMGALNFLNSQAAISLMRTRSDRFEAVI